MEEGKETKKKNQKPKTKKPYNRSKRFCLDMAPACVCILSHIRLCATPWTVVCHASLSMRFSRQDYWSGLPFSHPGDLPDPGIEPAFPATQVDFLPLSHRGDAFQDDSILPSSLASV